MQSLYFNPRAPCGARPLPPGILSWPGSISIHAPLAGRDRVPSRLSNPFTDISIHAPLAGRDLILFFVFVALLLFQSTRPLRGATLLSPLSEDRLKISIHAPLAGRDTSFLYTYYIIKISIHAPLAGRDETPAPVETPVVVFQSTRPLRGATALVLTATAALPVFQSTRPLRGATEKPAEL